ncbi:2925_t:CDS:2 [Ambispora leptoticha]|uniref:2925_t:CDS:1 n=1 Tax=Ambispora leptoticha TaxID=144679 RepID=A0A9N9G712_9GLOM|nr:2925_t:CDS:2 [Ambispora leptoticha]
MTSIPLWQRRAATPGIMDHPSKKNILADVKKDNALEKNKCDWTEWIIVREGKGSRQLGNLVNGVYKMKTDPTGSLIDNYSIIEGRDSEDL